MTRDISHGSKHVYLGRLVGSWSLVLFPGCRVLWFFLPVLFASAFCGVRAKNLKETASHTHGQLATPVALDHRVDPTSDPTSDLVICAVYGPASSLAKPPPAASPQLGRWICQQGLRSARMPCLLLVLAAARVLLLLCCCQSAAAAASTTTALAFLRDHISYSYDNSQASYYYYYCIYLLSIYLQSSAPASSRAEPPPAASPQQGRWICQQGLRSARIRGLLLVLAAAGACCCHCCCCCCAAASTTTALALLRLVIFRTGMIVLSLLLLLRLQPARDSRQSVCLGTSS